MSFETSATFSVVPELIPADLFHRASYKRRDVETEIIPSNCCHHTRVPLAVATGPACAMVYGGKTLPDVCIYLDLRHRITNKKHTLIHVVCIYLDVCVTVF